MEDYYSLLQLDRNADQEEIKKAYRKLALEHHPDRNGGSPEAEERFKEVTEAYEVLRDPDRRARYDRFGKEGLGRSQRGFSANMDFADALNVFMRDFGAGGFGGFEDLFGGGRRAGRPKQGKSLRMKVKISLAEVRTGARRRVRVAVLNTCDDCTGNGARDGAPPAPCPGCQGTGQERVVQRSMFGQFVSVGQCRRCRGGGTVILEHCKACKGEGRVRGERNIQVDIPSGVSSENYITLRNQGNVGPQGGPRGNIVVHLEVADDPRFTREGADLVTHVSVTFAQAALGDRISVPTVEGRTSVEVPAGTQSGEVIRVPGEGVPELHGRRFGDLVVRVAVWVPTRLDEEQRRLLMDLREIEDAPPEAHDPARRRGFWSRVKEALG